jgi:hypothetical protein
VSGGRDLITPPAIADRIASLIPGAVLLRLATAPHSTLDSRERAALTIAGAVCTGHHHRLAHRAVALDQLPSRPVMRLLVLAISAATAMESTAPALGHRTRRCSRRAQAIS